ncbi:MAG: GlsB/YeaQ/YmgE family stress response membrane protein [Candidatus Rokubacteria bacterium]|nr:GlsB/YeaQ/YmgE family stress response membrane protein [Candidatus Rokubacteria bacterium]
MDILLWIVFGLVVGIVAKFIMPGHDPGGIILTIVLGIVGAMLGGWVGRALGLYSEGEAAGFLMAVVGAVIVLALYRLVLPGRTRV